MSTTEPGFAGIDESAEDRLSAIPTELWSLLKTISHQIDEADQRHTGLLQELRDRLAALSQDAHEARGSIPETAAPAYARIEDGLAELANRIDAMDAPNPHFSAYEAAAPAALKSAALGAPPAPSADASRTSAIDPFDLVGEPDDGDSGIDWAAADAEALTRIYEESDAALVRTSPLSEQPAVEDPPVPAASLPQVTAMAPAADPLHIFSAAPAPAAAASVDRAWLDERLSEIALRIEQSLADLRPDLTLDNLDVRFHAFEERMGSVLGDVATRTDVESLRLLEGQIQDLAAHLEETERQLGRLDSIEQQLQAVIEHLSEGRAAEAGDGQTDFAAPDLRLLASSTAEEVAQRFAASMNGATEERRFDELGGLLRSMMEDRRHSDEQTYSMLDTVQQAMIRLLDRIDALEMAQVRPQPAPPAAAPPSMIEESHAEIQDFGAPDHAAPAFHVPPPLAPLPGGAVAPEMPAAQNPAEKLRQDFIADAQRAKMRAAAAAESDTKSAAAEGQQPQRAVRGMPRPKAPAAAMPAGDGAGSSRKQRLTALALCLVIAVSGAALFAKSRTKPADAVVPAAVTETAPEIEIPGPAPGSQATRAQSPVAPQVEAPSAAPAMGGAFEVPADEEPAVPAPVPAPEASVPAAPGAGGGPVTNESALGIDGEVSVGGEVLENRPDAPRPGVAPEGIILQDGGRQPTVQELAHLQNQQSTATLSSRLGANAARLAPADLMPEEVAKYAVTPIAATADDLLSARPVPASVGVAAMPGETIQMPAVTNGSKTVSPLSLPPATVGPLSLRLAAANGDPSAAFEVGARLAEGKGTDQNFKEAIVWYQKSAAQGFAQAQYRLGTLYERGLGVKADTARARMWYQRAAEQGNVKAMHNLAVLSAGRASGSPDYMTAAQWFQSAADYGLADSQYNLAVLFENGLGVAQNNGEAYKWYALAARGGDGEAIRRRDALKAQLEPDALSAAERSVASFTPKRLIALINDARVAGEDWKKREDTGRNG
jgi:localization factor PodJL